MNALFDNINEISCLVGNSEMIFIIYKDLSVKSTSISLKEAERMTNQFYFTSISQYVIINTKHIYQVENKRMIKLENGIRLKVSRRKWALFNQNQ